MTRYTEEITLFVNEAEFKAEVVFSYTPEEPFIPPWFNHEGAEGIPEQFDIEELYIKVRVGIDCWNKVDVTALLDDGYFYSSVVECIKEESD